MTLVTQECWGVHSLAPSGISLVHTSEGPRLASAGEPVTAISWFPTSPLDLQGGVRPRSTFTLGAPPGRGQMDRWWTGGHRVSQRKLGLDCFSLSVDGDRQPEAQCEGRWHEWQLFQWLVCSACLLTQCPVPTCHGLTSPFPAPLQARDGCRHGNPAHSD